MGPVETLFSSKSNVDSASNPTRGCCLQRSENESHSVSPAPSDYHVSRALCISKRYSPGKPSKQVGCSASPWEVQVAGIQLGTSLRQGQDDYEDQAVLWSTAYVGDAAVAGDFEPHPCASQSFFRAQASAASNANPSNKGTRGEHPYHTMAAVVVDNHVAIKKNPALAKTPQESDIKPLIEPGARAAIVRRDAERVETLLSNCDVPSPRQVIVNSSTLPRSHHCSVCPVK